VGGSVAVSSTEPGDGVTRLVDTVIALSGAFLAAGDGLVAEFGLTASRWLTLGAVQDGGLSIAQIARRRGLRRQSVRESVERLERDGLVERAADPRDARAPVVSLTATGRAALEAIEPKRAAWAAGLEASIDSRALAAALETLAGVRARLTASA
jgi:DNA-binding MarR family transcriptional regulator